MTIRTCQGSTGRSRGQIRLVARSDVSEEYQGSSYNLLSRNCNHFTSALCEKMTGRPAPSWLNRAASIGVALPCVVPREWIEPPDHETADGELVEDDEDDEDEDDERSRMLQRQRLRRRTSIEEERAVGEDRAQDVSDDDDDDNGGGRRSRRDSKGKSTVRDTSGRVVPASELAPVPTGR
ncbi:MAG: hypothetical protein M1832_000148 [Thelocarpon impressellum]|nr:MAG: hypothetical protein M1832_000148 [Thelocarpon impressellum]